MALEEALFGPAMDFREQLIAQGKRALADERYATYEGKREKGGYQCPKCWMLDGKDSILGPTGKKIESKEQYRCQCAFEFYY